MKTMKLLAVLVVTTMSLVGPVNQADGGLTKRITAPEGTKLWVRWLKDGVALGLWVQVTIGAEGWTQIGHGGANGFESKTELTFNSPTAYESLYALGTDMEYLNDFEDVWSLLGESPGSPSLHIPIPFQDLNEDNIPDDADLYYSVDLYTYLSSNWEFAQTSHIGEQVTVTNGEVMPGFLVGYDPITFTPGVGFTNPSPYGSVVTVGGSQDISPEPATIGLLGLGALSLLRKRRT